MELELGLKITRDADDQSSASFCIAKDRDGPVFVSTETDSVFILSATLKGFDEENVKININEDGTRITISGEKVVRETIMRGWKVYREEEKREFRKTFKIPNGVVLDQIKAKFGVEEPSLTIYMPKSEKGIQGHGIEEVNEEEKGQLAKPHEEMPLLKKMKKQPDEAESEASKSQELPKTMSEIEEDKPGEDSESSVSKNKMEVEEGKIEKAPLDQAKSSMEKEGEPPGGQIAQEEMGVGEKKSVFLAPGMLAGSALIVSLVVLVVGLVRSKRQRQ